MPEGGMCGRTQKQFIDLASEFDWLSLCRSSALYLILIESELPCLVRP